MSIRVVDLFAGPGGLGEGFSSFQASDGGYPFRTLISVEKDPSAHSTLLLRAFFRQIREKPEALLDYERYRSGQIDRKTLFDRWSVQHNIAQEEVLGRPMELGRDNEEIFNRIWHLKINERLQNEPWIVIGGPPCQAYSLVGRARNRGNIGYSPEKDERNFLYREYLKVLAKVRPEVFVMENVRGILSAKVGGELIFPRILEDLHWPGRAEGIIESYDLEYRIFSLVKEGDDLTPKDFLIQSEEYGVPQKRHRVILLGIRADISKSPGILQPQKRKVTVGEVLGKLPELRSKISRGGDSPDRWIEGICREMEMALPEIERMDPHLSRHISCYLAKLSDKMPLSSESYVQNVDESFSDLCPDELKDWLCGMSRTLTGHRSRGHMVSDLGRYFYASVFAIYHGRTPKAEDFPSVLAPDHVNWTSGKFNDRFRVQLRNEPATTVTSHISKDGHYFIHPDPLQCRSLTVREAARLQTFPDDYHFEGNQTQQYVQVGNAVPPFLARQIAAVVHEVLD